MLMGVHRARGASELWGVYSAVALGQTPEPKQHLSCQDPLSLASCLPKLATPEMPPSLLTHSKLLPDPGKCHLVTAVMRSHQIIPHIFI